MYKYILYICLNLYYILVYRLVGELLPLETCFL